MPEDSLYRRSHLSKSSARKGFPSLATLLSMILFTGPMQLLTARISLKCAVLMILLCIPSLLYCAMLTLPGLIFQSPQQQANYYFALMLRQDPLWWLVFVLVACCAVLSLAMPTMIDPDGVNDGVSPR